MRVAYQKVAQNYPYHIVVRCDGNSFFRTFFLTYILNLFYNKNIIELVKLLKRIVAVGSMNYIHNKVDNKKLSVNIAKSFLLSFIFELVAKLSHDEALDLVGLMK